MNRRDLLAGLFWLAISVFVIIQSVKSDIGSLHTPGPGFLPFWSAIILGSLSIMLMVTRTRVSGGGETTNLSSMSDQVRQAMELENTYCEEAAYGRILSL